MGRLERAESILKAAALWRDRCLVGQGSILSNRRLWTIENLQHLRRHFVENPDEGPGTFLEKLQKQLAPAPPEAKQLAAELLWVMYLVVAREAMSGQTKRLQIQDVWEWSGEPIALDQWAMQEPLDDGIANPGTGYHTHRWREFCFFILAMIDWRSLTPEEQMGKLSDPWLFGKWIDERPTVKGRQLRHALLYLLFPDHYERILSSSHKKEIVKKFHESWGRSVEVDYSDLLELDRAVLEVRERASRATKGEPFDFYQDPHRAVWQGSREPEGADRSISTASSDAEAWFAQRFGTVGVWALSAGEGGRLWNDFQKNGVAAVGWDALGDFDQYESKEDVFSALVREGRSNPRNDSLAVWQFAHDIKPGDLIIAKRGRSGILGWGIVLSGCDYEPDRPEYHHVVRTEWKSSLAVNLPRSMWITNKTLTDFRPFKKWLRDMFSRMEAGVGGAPLTESEPSQNLYSVKDLQAEAFISDERITSILDALAVRKNVILQGAPGVGKTFLAKRFAWSLAGGRDSSRIETVQFHQSYSYEDFVQGWRPTEAGGFALKDGIFLRFCSRAASDPLRPHVFVIDEINRGNLSRVFGELMMLLEADKRGRENAITLTYSQAGEKFFVPENVYILGLMNTADRSLALVDYALRRRFAFFTLQPAFHTERFRDHLAMAGFEVSFIRRIEERMSRLNRRIREDAGSLGPGFEIGHSFFVPAADLEGSEESWFESVIRTQIEPLLREYWFDRPDVVDQAVLDLLS